MISQLALPQVSAPGSGVGVRGALQLLPVGSIMPARSSRCQWAEQQTHGPKPAGLEGEKSMVDSVYKIIELVGTSTESWEKAAGAAVAQAAKSLRDLRIVEVVQLDMQVQNGKVKTYRAKVKVSFKFEGKK
jgi:dodecin